MNLEKGTVVIPFSATSKQGRDEIYEIIDQIIEGEDTQTEPGGLA